MGAFGGGVYQRSPRPAPGRQTGLEQGASPHSEVGQGTGADVSELCASPRSLGRGLADLMGAAPASRFPLAERQTTGPAAGPQGDASQRFLFALQEEAKRDLLVPVPALMRRLGIPPEQAKAMLSRLNDEGALYLSPHDCPGNLSAEDKAYLPPASGGIGYYASPISALYAPRRVGRT